MAARASTPPPRGSTRPVAATTQVVGTADKGMPDIDESGFWNMVPMFSLLLFIPRFIGLGVAVAIFKMGSTSFYETNIERLDRTQQGWVFLSAVVFSFMCAWVNNYPMLYKNMVMRMNSGNLRANMMIYKAADSQGYTVLETEGAIGSYNRANRSLTHFTENALPQVLCMLLAGQVFPFPTFVLTVVFAVGRILHQMGYSKGYGGHAVGFALSWLATSFLEMLVLFAALRSLNLIPEVVQIKLEL